MANLTILYDLASDKGSLSGSGNGWAGALPPANLRNDDLAAVARYLDIRNSPARLVAGFDRVRPVNAWALIGHNASSLATMRVGLADAPSLSPVIYQSPTAPVWEPTIVWGSLPWGVWPFDGVDKETFPGAPIAFHLSPETHYAQYAFLEVADPGNPDGYFQAGRLMIGQGWVAPDVENHDYGSSVQIIDMAEKTRTKGGRRLVGEAPKYRQWEIKLSYQSEATALGVYHDLMWRGIKGDLLVIWDSDKEPAIRNRLTLYGALAGTSPITIVEHDGWDVVLQIEELI
ncbi:hypothetical protein [Niveispirillum sp. BGYR6]|uniref:hypothetical protein n=1 Tax=Niveispirillum sp. BGYR6 TaxID=2971249 RepID=UPI0022B97B11|nr:hypothetical protein [Niveispirillum sp. BGYR6]MDG5497424.1 hypothetical protein [Niveispirillum sp. BGYR6]